MTDEQPQPHPGHLTNLQRARIDFARRDLEYTRAEDLAQLAQIDAHSLILMIERLRARLDDMLQLIDETTGTEERQS